MTHALRVSIVHRKTTTIPMIPQTDQDRIFGIMRHKNHGMAQIAHMVALLHGIRSALCIRALDRAGGYGCELVAKPDRGPVWRELVLRARECGIYENELEGLAMRAEKRKRSITRSGA